MVRSGALLFFLYTADVDVIITNHGLMSHFMLTTLSCIYAVVRITFNSCGSSRSSAL